MLHKGKEESAPRPADTNMMAIQQIYPMESSSDPPKDLPCQCFSPRIRVAIDMGATSFLISEKLASHLRLRHHPHRLQITGACGKGVSKHFVELTLQSLHDEQQILTTKFSVVGHLPAAPSPTNNNQVKNEPHLRGLQLADPHFGGSLKILIGGWIATNAYWVH